MSIPINQGERGSTKGFDSKHFPRQRGNFITCFYIPSYRHVVPKGPVRLFHSQGRFQIARTRTWTLQVPPTMGTCFTGSRLMF